MTTRPRQILFGVGMLAMVFLAIEVGFRGIVAIRTGPRALAYGFVADRRYETPDLNLHDEERAGYSKYFPGQRLRDHNPDTGKSFATITNAEGFRGRDFGPKSPGTVRIVTLGASSTFGYHSEDHETYPAQLERRLNDLCPNRTVQVFNLGIPHLMSGEIATLLEREGLPLEPDIVTFYEGINDATARSTRHQLRRGLRRFDVLRSPYRWLRDRFLTLRFVDEVLRPRVTPYDGAAVAAHLSGRADTFFASLDRMRALCDARDVRFVVVRQQAKSFHVPRGEITGVTYAEERARVQRKLQEAGRLEPPEAWFLAHAQLMERLPGWAAANEVPFVDGTAALDARRDVLLSWVHLTPEGNGLLADALAAGLVEFVCSP